MSQKLKLVILYTIVTALSVLTASYFVSHRKITPELYDKVMGKFDTNPGSVFRFDPDISYMLKPGYTGKRYSTDDPHQTNSRGLLGKDEIPGGDTRKKILFLGDSVAYGDGVAFEKTAITLMQKAAGSTFVLANGSCPGWSTKQELLYYRKYLSDIKWDAIVIFFCLNDLLNFEWVYDSKNDFKMSAELENIGGLTGFKDKAVESVRIWRIRDSFEADRKLQPLANFNNTCLVAWEKDKWQSYNKEVLAPFLTSQNRPPVIMVAMPTLLQILAERAGAPAEQVMFPQRMLQSYSRAPRTAFIDAAPALSSGIKEPQSAYLERDYLHFSEKGHEMMAAYLWPALEKQLQRVLLHDGKGK